MQEATALETAYWIRITDFSKRPAAPINQLPEVTVKEGGLQRIAIDSPVNQPGWGTTKECFIVTTQTGINGTKRVFPHNLQIKAQTSKTLGNVKHWRALVDGTQNPTNCSSPSIRISSAETRRIRLTLTEVEDYVTGGSDISSQHACNPGAMLDLRRSAVGLRTICNLSEDTALYRKLFRRS